jgi:hypothetical protein
MRKNIFLLSIVATILFTSCGTKETYKLHERVGEVYEDGVIFYVSDNGTDALICSFTDLQNKRGSLWDMAEYKWNDFARDTFLQTDTVWVVTSPTDSTARIDSTWFYGFIGATSEDNGIENTDKIINHRYPTKPSKFGASAAKDCRAYFLGMYYYNVTYKDTSRWKVNTGEWYLPSMQEARYLAYAKGTINEKMASHDELYPGGKRNLETMKLLNPWGWEALKNCYWTSTERNGSTAYYKCIDGENQPESYIPKNSTTFLLSVRPIRKVQLR